MREFRQSHTRGKDRVWKIEVEENLITTWWGTLGGKLQNTTETISWVGVKKTKSFVSAVDQAQLVAERMIRKKLEEGYLEVVDGEVVGISAGAIQFSKKFPKNLSFSKPLNSKPEKKARQLIKENRVILTVKRNGMMHAAMSDEAKRVSIYSRRMDEVTNKYPHIVEELRTFMAANSVFLGEMVSLNQKGEDSFRQMQMIENAKVEKALERQQQLGLSRFVVFRVPFWKNLPIETTDTHEQWIQLLGDIMERNPTKENVEYLQWMDNSQALTYDQWLDQAQQMGIEGYVVYEKEGSFGDRSYNFKGKPDRPSSCWKLKPTLEDDFIAYFSPDNYDRCKKCKSISVYQKTSKCELCDGSMIGNGTWGKGKHTGQVGTLSLYQLREDDPYPVYICEVGSGFTDEQKAALAKKPLDFWPQVVEVKFAERKYLSRGQISNALTHPRFSRFRTDKTWQECFNEDL